MYRSIKGKIACCLGVFGKRQHGVSNNLVWLAVCLFQKAGGVL